MPRTARVKSDTGIYHIILRSVNQQIVFEEDPDYLKFLYILSDCKEKYDFDIYAYCLMSNHIHLLLHDHHNKLSSIFQSLESRFARWYNQKYQRFGHLFQERYFSAPVADESYFFSVLCYIHANPIKSNICRYITEYRWSSARAYWGGNDHFVDTQYACDLAGSMKNVQKLLSMDESDESRLQLGQHKSQPRYYTDDIALDKFKKISKCNSPAEVQKMPKAERNNLVRLLAKECLSYNHIARFCGITKTTVYRILREYKEGPGV